MTTDTDFDINGHFKVNGYGGIAWYCEGYVEYPDVDTEMVTDHTKLKMIMVGDDTIHEIDIEDVEPIDEESFCRDCGQIGCGHNTFS